MSSDDDRRFLRLKNHVRLLRPEKEQRLYRSGATPLDLDMGLTSVNLDRAGLLVTEIFRLIESPSWDLTDQELEKKAQGELRRLLETQLLKSNPLGTDRVEIYEQWIYRTPKPRLWMILEWIDALEKELIPNPEGDPLMGATILLQTRKGEARQERALQAIDELGDGVLIQVRLNFPERKRLAWMLAQGSVAEQALAFLRLKESLGNGSGIVKPGLEQMVRRFKSEIALLREPKAENGESGIHPERGRALLLDRLSSVQREKLLAHAIELGKILGGEDQSDGARSVWAQAWVSQLLGLPLYLQPRALGLDRLEIYEATLRGVPERFRGRAVLLVDATELSIRHLVSAEMPCESKLLLNRIRAGGR